MTNPNPPLSNRFIESQYKTQRDIPLDRNPTKVKLPVSVSKAIRELPNSAGWLREVIVKAAQEDGLV